MTGAARPDPGAPAAAALAAFEAERRRLFAVAYRMLGSAADAEDLLQEAWLRWRAVPPDTVQHPPAYLMRLVTRLALDALKSAHARRLEYVGPWLPEPLIEEHGLVSPDATPELQELADELSLAFLVLLERLNPVERAVFLLRESFGFDYREIAAVVGKTEANCRQLDRRARARLAGAAPARPVDRSRHAGLVERFLHATRAGDVEGLLRLLADDVVAYADGGGRVTAARKPVAGAAAVARYLTKIYEKVPPGTELRVGRVNGEPGLLTWLDGELRNAIAFALDGERIRRIYIVVNPEKLAGVARGRP